MFGEGKACPQGPSTPRLRSRRKLNLKTNRPMHPVPYFGSSGLKAPLHLAMFIVGIYLLVAGSASVSAQIPTPTESLDPSAAALLYAGRLSDGNIEGILDLFAEDV